MKLDLLSLYLFYSRTRHQLPVLTLMIVVLVGGIVAFPLSYVSNTNVLIGCLLLPFSFFITGHRRLNWAYLLVAMIAAALALVYHIRIFYFFSIAFFILSLIESTIGKTGYLLIFLFLFMSPFFEQVAVILGFPIRLQLSQWAGMLLKLMGNPVSVQGNGMMMQGGVFFVDDACMGLHLLSISLLMGVFSLSHFSRMLRLQLSFFYMLSFFCMVFGLNILSNLIRICILVMFSIPAENAMHHGVGIFCLLLYVMTPIYFLSRFMVYRFGKALGSEDMRRSPINRTHYYLMSVLAVSILIIGFAMRVERGKDNQRYANVRLEDFEQEHIGGGVTKLTKNQFLVYVKPIAEFFSAEHTPLICWKGSGYEFEGIRKEIIAGRDVYIGSLRQGEDKLETAWWYDNGTTSTISQTEWRLRMLQGEPDFCLVNITTSDRELLRTKLYEVFEKDLLTLNDQ